MALKFLNKKGWHTGSLRNIETVWKAEQKHEGEQKKLEELRKQIQDEREKSEFRLMQEQAGLVPKQERLEFLYDSGLQVGKVAQADEYLLGKPVEEAVQPENDVGQVAAKPGALFVEEKPASANDSWRKLHSDPLFLIKQQEQAAIARITSNPVKMAGIKKAAEMKKKLKEEKKKKRKEAKRERREKRKRKKQHVSSSDDSSDSDNPRKNRKKHRHDSGDSDGDAGHKRAQIKPRNLSRSSSRSPTRSPVRKDRRESPRKLRDEERELAKRKRASRSPAGRDQEQGRSRRNDFDSRVPSKLVEGRQWEHKASDSRLKEFEGRESEKRKRALSRSASRSPVRRNHDRSMSRKGDVMGTSQGEGSKREYATKGSEGRDYYEKRKGVPPRSPSKSPSRSPVIRSSVWRGFASRSPVRRSPARRDYDQRLKGSNGRDFYKRKRVPSRSPLRSPSRSPSRSPVHRSPVRRSSVRRDHDRSRSRRDDFDSRGEGRQDFAFKGEGRQREQRVSDERRKGPEDRGYEKRKRAPSRSPSRSLSRSPGRSRNYGQSSSRRDDLDCRDEQRHHREYNSSDQRLKEPGDHDSRPHDTRLKSSSNGFTDDLRSTESHEKLHAEVQGTGKKDNTNGTTLGVSSTRPGNKGRPPKPGQLSDAERAARLAEMQANADVHEEQRWQRLKRAADADVVEAKRTEKDKSNEQFIADTQKSIFGAERGNGSSTIEKSVKRRAHFIERSSGDNEKNAFRR